MGEGDDYIVEINHPADEASRQPGEDRPVRSGGDRRWLGVQFDCCGVYARIYRNRAQTAYVGHCPRCGRSIRIRIGPDGTNHRFFRAR